MLPPAARRLIPPLSSSHVGTAAATTAPATAANDDDRDAILGHATPTAQRRQEEKGAGLPSSCNHRCASCVTEHWESLAPFHTGHPLQSVSQREACARLRSVKQYRE